MSTTQTDIGELDAVTLRNPVDGWPAGAEGTVVSVFPIHLWVAVPNEEARGFDLAWVLPEDLDLVQKHSTSGAD